ncbi:metallophosphoesterase family protein, partial [Staphylococcus felis]
ALGHIHKREQLSDLPEIHYPGNIQGRHFKEQGEKGCLLVEGDHIKFKTQFVPTHFVRFDSAVIEVENTNRQYLYEKIQTFKNSVRHLGRAIYRLQVNVSGDNRFDSQTINQVKEMIADYEENEHHFVFIDELIIHYTELVRTSISKEFPQELLLQDDIYENALQDLYMNPKASKYLDHFQKYDREALINRAENIIYTELKGDE